MFVDLETFWWSDVEPVLTTLCPSYNRANRLIRRTRDVDAPRIYINEPRYHDLYRTEMTEDRSDQGPKWPHTVNAHCMNSPVDEWPNLKLRADKLIFTSIDSFLCLVILSRSPNSATQWQIFIQPINPIWPPLAMAILTSRSIFVQTGHVVYQFQHFQGQGMQW